LLTRLLLPALALALLLTFGLDPPGALLAPMVVGLIVLGALAVAAFFALRATSHRRGARTSRASALISRVFGDGVVDARDRVHADLRAIVRRSRRRMSLAMAGYALLQATLLWLCLVVVGAPLSPLGTFAAFAVGSALSLVPFTPGGVGFAEAGTAAVLYGIGGGAGGGGGGGVLVSGLSRLGGGFVRAGPNGVLGGWGGGGAPRA